MMAYDNGQEVLFGIKFNLTTKGAKEREVTNECLGNVGGPSRPPRRGGEVE